ncbi:PAS domain-containing protein [Candidatus Deferrimicrobium sp.]|uniref:PAS domain-containing protein n=1 Tax=Candidatus Deferrimicrobium sp. TaxID=3060586 RepID=UPI003C69267C
MNVYRPISLPDVEEIDRPAASRTLATLIEASPLAIVTFDPEGVVTLWSPAAERIFGWSENEALGTRLPFVPAEKQEEFLALRRRALLGEVFTEPELHRRRADGSPIVVSASTSPLRRPDGTIYGILTILMDVTEHKSAGNEEVVRQLARKVREVLDPAGPRGNLQHDPR